MSPDNLFFDSEQSPNLGSIRFRGGLYLIILFLTTVFLTAILARWTVFKDVRFGAGEVLSDKHRLLQNSADDSNVFFLGTSHIYRGIVPAIFDEVCQKSGVLVKSYNTGVFRLGILEAEGLLNTLIKRRDQRAPWLVLIEPSLLDCDFKNWTSERELFSHEWSSTRKAVGLHWNGFLQRQSVLLMTRHVAAMASHIGSGVVNQLNYGLASRFVFPESERFATSTYTEPPIDGFVPLDKEIARRRDGKMPATELPDNIFSRKLQEGTLERNQITRRPMASGTMFYERVIHKVEAAGGQILFLATPRITAGSPLYGDDIEAMLKAPSKAISERLLGDYRYIGEESALFQSENWFDPEHLNRRGAESFTTLLADDFVARVRSSDLVHLFRTSNTP